MFTKLGLINGSCLVASGLAGWWFIPFMVAAGMLADRLNRIAERDDDN